MVRPFRLARAALALTLAAACFAAPVRAAELDKYLPDGTLFVLSVNVKNLIDSPLLRGDEKAFKTAMGEASKVLDEFGVNPEKDLERLLIAGGQGMQPNSFLMLLEGTFDTAKIQAQLATMVREKKGNIEAAEDGPAGAYQVRLPRQGRGGPGVPNRMMFTVLDRTLIAFAADKDALADVIAKKKGDKRADVKREMLTEIQRIDPKQTASVVIMPPPEMLANSPAANLTKITGGVTVSQGIKTDLLLTTKDGASARELSEKINDGLAQFKQLVPVFAGQQPGVGPKQIALITEVIDSFKATAQPNGVAIKSDITKQLIDKAKAGDGPADK